MRRHIKSIDLVLLIELLEFERVVALMAVNYQQLPCTYSTILCMLNKVLQLGDSQLISSPAVFAQRDAPIARYILLVLGKEVVLAGEDSKGQDCLSSSVNVLDYYNLLAIAQLDYL